jgi:hypothetical protein
MTLLVDQLMGTYSYPDRDNVIKALHYVKLKKGLGFTDRSDKSILLRIKMTEVMDKAFKEDKDPFTVALEMYKDKGNDTLFT